MKLEVLAEQLNSTERTVQEDIRELKNSGMSHIFDIDARAQEYKIQLCENISIDTFGHSVMKDNDCYRILECVFFNDSLSIDDLAERHHMSMPTIYRIVSRINHGFKDYFNLEFQTHPCGLVGDEVEVRSFYLQYFTERYPLTEWPFKNIYEDKMLFMFKNIAEAVGFNLQFSDLTMLKLSLAVSHTRFNQAHKTEERGPRLTAILNDLYTSDQFLKIFKSVFKDDVDSELFDDTFAYLLEDYFFFNYESFLNSTSEDEYSARSFTHLTNMIEDLSQKYKIPVNNKETLIFNMHNSAQLGIRYINVRPILINNKQMLLTQVKNLFPVFYNDMMLKMSEYLSVMELKDNLLPHLLHNFLTVWDDLLQSLYLTQRKIKIRVISSHDIFHARLIRSLLQKEFYNQVEVSLIETMNLDELLSDLEKMDIIVTNFTLPISAKHIIAVNDIPTNDDFKVIHKLIRDIHLGENKI